jgi:hypothetical protein
MVEHKIKCVETTHKKTEEGEEWRYKYRSVPLGNCNKFEIQIWTEDPLQMTDETGFPREEGDTITVSTGTKETQGRLDK